MSRKLAFSVLIGLAFFPVGYWYLKRLSDGSDEPWGVLALVTLAYFLWRNRKEVVVRPSGGTAVFLLAYAALFPLLPPLGRAGIAALTLISCVNFRGRRFHAGASALVLLSLPVLPTLQFCFGYPLRVVIAYLTAAVLRCADLAVSQSGTLLQFGEKLIFVDAPCSGMRMLWMGSFLSACLLCHFQLSRWRSAQLVTATFVFMLAANVLRSLYLFFLEVFLPQWAELLHAGMGMLVFAGAASGILYFAMWLKSNSPDYSFRPRIRKSFSPQIVFCLLMLAALAPLRESPAVAKAVSSSVNWPHEFEGERLIEAPLSERERKFVENFPGQVKRFNAGNKELLIRYVEQPTRKLHPSADCLKGVGYTLTPLAAELGENGGHWSCNLATRGAEKLKVCDRISDTHANTWPDASSWYWSALWQPSSGPWWAYTVSTPQR